MRKRCASACGLTGSHWSSRSARTTATCCATSSSPAFPSWGSTRPARRRRRHRPGIPTEIGLFNTGTAMEIAVRHGRADLVIANNVLPHVPDLFDFAAGFASILRPNGVLSLQVPHLLSLVQKVQFDAFRHDSYTYLSLQVLERVLRSVGLRVFDAERRARSWRIPADPCLPRHQPLCRPPRTESRPHGGNLRRAGAARSLRRLQRPGGRGVRGHPRLPAEQRAAGRRVAAFGAAARGSTLLNCLRHHHRT